MQKCFVIELNGKHVRTVFSNSIPKIGSIYPDEDWLGHKIAGGTITKIYN